MEHIFLAVQEMLSDNVPEIRWSDYDVGQLEHYELRPPVQFPCALIDLEIPEASDQTFPWQLCKATVILRIAFEPPGQTHNKVPENIKTKAMSIFGILNKTRAFLHGFEGAGFNKLLFRSMIIERREDPLKVFVMRFNTSFTVTKPDKRIEVKPELVVFRT